MDSSNCTLYLEDGFDPREFLDQYFSEDSSKVFGDDYLIFPMENLKNIFALGNICGDVLLDISIGSTVHQFYTACEFFKCIIALRARYTCIMELKRWLDSRTGAFDWGYSSKLLAGIEGESDQFEEKAVNVRKKVIHVVKCNLDRENIMEPMALPLADCIISAWLLDAVCNDQNDYRVYLRKFLKLLKPGGHLILLGMLDTTFYMVGEDKIRCFSYNVDFAKKALGEEGFVINYCQVKKRTNVSKLTDYKGFIIISAHKVN